MPLYMVAARLRAHDTVCTRQAALASAIERRLAGDPVSEELRRAGGKGGGGAARHVKLEHRATGSPLAGRFAKYGRSVDGPKPEAGANGVGGDRSAVWSADERAAAMVLMDRVPTSPTAQQQPSLTFSVR